MQKNGDTLGIVFTGGEGPQEKVLKTVFSNLAAETIIAAADSGITLAEKAGLKPDWIIGDMDSIKDEACLEAYPPERIIRYHKEKDLTDTELALNLLWEKGCSSIWIAGGGGGRIDHLFGIRDLFEREQFPKRWLTASEDIYCIDAALNDRLYIAAGKDTFVSVFPLGNGPWKTESTGLKWALNNVKWERGYYGLSNLAICSEVEIIVLQGRFMVIFTGIVCQR